MLQKQPWHKLSQLVGARGVKADWTGFPDRLLNPTNDLAETHPCRGRCGGYMDVVRHGDGTFVGVCSSGCDKRALQKTDLIVYRPDFTAIFSGLAQAFGVNGVAHAEVDGLPACWQIGEYNPAASYRFPVVAMIEAQTGRIERAIGQLAARYNNPFFVLLPSAPAVTQSIQDVALRNGAKVFAYEDLVEFTNDAIQVRDNASSILSDLVTAWIKNIDPSSDARFPTPPGAEWKDITIKFTDGHTVRITCKGVTGVYGYFQMGMNDGRKAAPNKQWELMAAFAEGRGDLDWDRQGASRSDKSKKKLLKQALQKFFGIFDDDPIEDYKNHKNQVCYRSKFNISPED